MANAWIVQRLNQFGYTEEPVPLCGECAFMVIEDNGQGPRGICSARYHKFVEEFSEVDAAVRSIVDEQDEACGLFEEEK